MITKRHSPKIYLLSIIFLLVIVFVLSAVTATGQTSLHKTQETLAFTQNELTTTETNLGSTQTELTTTENTLAQTQTELASTQTELTTTKNTLAQTQTELASTQTELTTTKNTLAQIQTELASTQTELTTAIQPPYTTISGRQVTWAWRDISGNLHKWTMPIDTYRSWIDKPTPNPTLTLKSDYQTFQVYDYRPLMDPSLFTNVVTDFASQYTDGLTFAKEMFNLVTQLDVYSTVDVGRWPVETMTEAGGDCKNLSILFASLLKASPFPYKLQLIYMDSDHPTDPIVSNHAFIGVTLSGTTVYVDCTSKGGWDYWKQFKGWFYDIPSK